MTTTLSVRGHQLAILIWLAKNYELPTEVSKEILSNSFPEDNEANISATFPVVVYNSEKEEFITMMKAAAGHEQTEKSVSIKLYELATLFETAVPD